MRAEVKAFFGSILIMLALIVAASVFGALGALFVRWRSPEEIRRVDTVTVDPSPPAFVFDDTAVIRGWFCRDSLWTPTDTLLPRDTVLDTPTGPYRLRTGALCP